MDRVCYQSLKFSFCTLKHQLCFCNNPSLFTGYSFELVPFKENFPPDWEAAEKISRETYIVEPEGKCFKIWNENVLLLLPSIVHKPEIKK